ncbi:hypothetical protein BAAM0483_02395 [Bifidobacterium animalis subsp. animalis MCC 0483]|uniref:Uncharacterized protein n=1 Tax=Bifidobacterium animalis subsp. animalis MCC 0483 TaxID=1365955 RepID=A0AB34TAN8_9BIFI|nr:hypothetical protein [Bifidobacterium animalis]KOA51102.1 hypothetical protein BAAM0483_02395 [Bifidobacterium animalis subsp. animalis MCC 0483]
MENSEQVVQAAPQEHEEGRLAAENAKRRIQAREAAQRADAAEAEAASLRAQIAELRLAQARQAVTAALIEQYAPEGVDADSLSDWAEKALGLVVALRGEKEPDTEGLSDAERELAETKMELARQQAMSDYEHVSAGVLDALCAETTPEGVMRWSAEFERLVGEMPEQKPAPKSMLVDAIRDSNMSKVSPGKWVGADEGTGLEKVAKRLKR